MKLIQHSLNEAHSFLAKIIALQSDKIKSIFPETAQKKLHW